VLSPCFSLMALFLVWFNHETSLPAAINFSGPCCVKYLSKSFPSRHVTMYQNTSSHCPQPGVIFTTFKGKSFCGNPQEEWVQNILKQHKDQADS
ncbi:CCL24 protein, partial [Asarcornis scutulata]|nr:CCL24 protein [Asarcornis scutulata]